MQHEEFIGQVQARGKLANLGQSERVVRSVLETLSERIPAGLAGNLAAQLPHEIGEHLRRVHRPDGDGDVKPFDLGTFVDHVAEKSGLDRPQATYATRVVCEVTEEATQGSVMTKVYQALPPDLRALVHAGSEGHAQIPKD